MKTRRTSHGGFTLVEIMIVVGTISLLAVIAIPNFFQARSTSQMKACINNLRQLDDATQQYALENNKSSTEQVSSSNIIPYLGRSTTGYWPQCPSGGRYGITRVSEKPTCTMSALGHELPY